jgi:hypothetical protein
VRYFTGWMLVCSRISHTIVLVCRTRFTEHPGLYVTTVAGSVHSECVGMLARW